MIISFILLCLIIILIAIYLCRNRGCIVINHLLIKYIGFANKINIPNNVYAIGREAFLGNNRIESVFISSSVVSICDCAFLKCENLKRIEFAGNSELRYINHLAFEGCHNLTEITLPPAMLGIASQSFFECTGLEKIILPKSFSFDTIPWGAFANCINLKEIIIPDNIKYIGVNAFKGSDNLDLSMIPSTAIVAPSPYSTETEVENDDEELRGI